MQVKDLQEWVARLTLDTLDETSGEGIRWDSFYFLHAYQEALEQIVVLHPESVTTSFTLTGAHGQYSLRVPADLDGVGSFDRIVAVTGVVDPSGNLVRRVTYKSLGELDTDSTVTGTWAGVCKKNDISELSFFAYDPDVPDRVWLSAGLPEGYGVEVEVSYTPNPITPDALDDQEVPVKARYNAQLVNAIVARCLNSSAGSAGEAAIFRKLSIEGYQLATNEDNSNSPTESGSHSKRRR